jgi:hypothetical protein
MAMLIKNRMFAAPAALTYVTVGALMVVWSLIWYWYLSESEAPRRTHFYFCYGFLGSGIILLLIGLGVGRLGRSARQAELPPKEATPTVAQTAQPAILAPSVPVEPVGRGPVAQVPVAQQPLQVSQPVERAR